MDVILVLIATVLTIYSTEGQLEELKGGDYCMTEQMEAVCRDDEVIVMQTARYGRMKLGRCVKTDFGFVGCSSDVLDLADNRCSGRHQCIITVPDPMFENTKPCNEEFKFYLEATYTCRKVAMAQKGLCQAYDHVAVPVDEQQGYIANMVTETSGCGGDDNPWRIQAQPGQKINLTLIDFTSGQQSTVARFSQTCLIYAYVMEERSTERVRVCGGTGNREKHVYTSVSSTVDIIIRKSYQQQTNQFLIKYEIIGCEDPPSPKGGWMRRDGNRAELGCHEGDGTWILTCNNMEWTGDSRKCTADGEEDSESNVFYDVLSLPLGLSVTVIIAIAIGVSFVILLIGLCIIRSKRRALTQHQQQILSEAAQYARYQYDKDKFSIPCDYDTDLAGGVPTTGRHYSTGAGGDKGAYTENEYAYVWDNNTPPAPPSQASKHRLPVMGHDVAEEGALGGAISPRRVGGGGSGALYEPTKIRKASQGDPSFPLPLPPHSIPQYYEIDPELSYNRSNQAAGGSTSSGYSHQLTGSDKMNSGQSDSHSDKQDRRQKLSSMIDRHTS